MADDVAPNVQDLSEWIGEPITESMDVARAGRVIAYAWTLVNRETERDNAYWQTMTNSEGTKEIPEDVVNVVLQVAGRGYLNPESWGNERADDWGAGGRPVEELGMYLTGTERGILSRWVKRSLRSIGAVGTFRDEPTPDGPWTPTDRGIPIRWY